MVVDVCGGVRAGNGYLEEEGEVGRRDAHGSLKLQEW
jgi:hypothetical protein